MYDTQTVLKGVEHRHPRGVCEGRRFQGEAWIRPALRSWKGGLPGEIFIHPEVNYGQYHPR